MVYQPRFPDYLPNVGSADGAVTITPSDSTVLSQIRAVYVGTGGNLTVVLGVGGSQVLLKNVPSGILLPISPSRVLLTGTTAADMVGLL